MNEAAYAFRPLQNQHRSLRGWRPSVLQSGRVVLFHGHLANAAQLARELGDARSDGELYGLCFERWGDHADSRLVGEYSAVMFDPAKCSVRLVRSPLRAPPVHYFADERRLVAASVPRAIFAAGVPRILNEDRVVDSAVLNFTDESADWYKGLLRVPLGSAVEICPSRTAMRRFFDPAAVPDVRFKHDRDYVERAGELLDEGVKAALAGARRPGTTLSGGLDSSQVAARALRLLPDAQRLPSFTFVPEAGYDGVAPAGMVGDERPLVERFVALHPRIDPHFVDNAGIGHDHRWDDLFHVMGVAPSGLCNMYAFHGLFAGARAQGCDRLLLAEWGNYTFSAKGTWAFTEYFLKGRWRQLYAALRRHPHDQRSMFRRFLALSVMPLLPQFAWNLVHRVWHPKSPSLLDLVCPLTREYRAASGADARAFEAGWAFGRFEPKSRREEMSKLLALGDAEASEVYQGFEQLYGIEQRDPTAYRPFVEFCLGLPSEMFLRDGEQRWLAKRIAQDILPEEQRANRLNGRWDADWRLRIGRRRKEYLDDLERLSSHPRFANMLDTAKLRAALEDFPEETPTDPQRVLPLEVALPRALLTARFINFVEGRNDP